MQFIFVAILASSPLCDFKCRRLRCDTLSSSFSCSELDRLGCVQCHGCCLALHTSPPPPPPPPSPPPPPPPPPPPSPNLDCQRNCRRLTCGVLGKSLSCGELTTIGCDCGTCCASAPAAHQNSTRSINKAIRRVRRTQYANATVTANATAAPIDPKYCCYSTHWPNSYCRVRKTPACEAVSCEGKPTPPCTKFCRHEHCNGCAGAMPGEVTKGAYTECVKKGAALSPVCGHSVQYASPCLAQSMCYVSPTVVGLRAMAGATPPARERAWKPASSEGEAGAQRC